MVTYMASLVTTVSPFERGRWLVAKLFTPVKDIYEILNDFMLRAHEEFIETGEKKILEVIDFLQFLNSVEGLKNGTVPLPNYDEEAKRLMILYIMFLITTEDSKRRSEEFKIMQSTYPNSNGPKMLETVVYGFLTEVFINKSIDESNRMNEELGLYDDFGHDLDIEDLDFDMLDDAITPEEAITLDGLQCAATQKDGKRCKYKSQKGCKYCGKHKPPRQISPMTVPHKPPTRKSSNRPLKKSRPSISPITTKLKY